RAPTVRPPPNTMGSWPVGLHVLQATVKDDAQGMTIPEATAAPKPNKRAIWKRSTRRFTRSTLSRARPRVVASARKTTMDPHERPRGKVWLVGAGPGDPDLITCRGRSVLEQAEVVL